MHGNATRHEAAAVGHGGRRRHGTCAALLLAACAAGLSSEAVADEKDAKVVPCQPPDGRLPEAVNARLEPSFDGFEPGREPAPTRCVSVPAPRSHRRGGSLASALAYDRQDRDRLELRLPARPAAFSAFATKLDEEALHFLDTNQFAIVPDELLDDDNVREGRRHATERVLGRAAEAWLGEKLGLHRVKKVGTTRLSSGFTAGIALDETPSWTIRRRGPTGGMRLELPLTDSALKFYRWHELSGAHGIERIGTAVAINPFDDEASVVVRLNF